MKSVLTLLTITVFGINAFAQDALFTQKTGNINHFNPALVGTQSNFGVQLNYRNQSPSIINNTQNYSILTNYTFKSGLGIGVGLQSDVLGSGLLKVNDFKANVNYAVDFGEVETRYGLNIGAGQRSVDWDRLRFEDQIDPGAGFVNDTAEPFVGSTQNYLLVDLGAAAYYKGFMFSAGAQQINQPNISIFGAESKNPVRLIGSLAYMKELGNHFSLAGMFIYQHQNEFSMFETQIYSQYKFMKLGLGHHQAFGTFSNTDFFSASAGVQFDKFSVGYSYDDNPFNTSSSVARGTHQATAAWYIKGMNKEKGMSRLMNVLM